MGSILRLHRPYSVIEAVEFWRTSSTIWKYPDKQYILEKYMFCTRDLSNSLVCGNHQHVFSNRLFNHNSGQLTTKILLVLEQLTMVLPNWSAWFYLSHIVLHQSFPRFPLKTHDATGASKVQHLFFDFLITPATNKIFAFFLLSFLTCFFRCVDKLLVFVLCFRHMRVLNYCKFLWVLVWGWEHKFIRHNQPRHLAISLPINMTFLTNFLWLPLQIDL